MSIYSWMFKDDAHENLAREILSARESSPTYIEATKDLMDTLYSMIYDQGVIRYIGVDSVIELPRGRTIGDEGAEDLDLLMFPRLVETIEGGTKRYAEVSKQRAATVNKVLSDWFDSLSTEMPTQYRYVGICSAPNCSNKVEFFSFVKGEDISWTNAPKCKACK